MNAVPDRSRPLRNPDAAAPMRPSLRPARLPLHLADEAATARFGAALAACLGPGDTVLLSGPLGAGKSALARAVIAALIGNREAENGGEIETEIPSPSYTLVNVYETPRGQVWHADLYRLGGEAEEIEELGLPEAMSEGTALVLVEWPERLGGALPARRLAIALSAPERGGRDAAVRLHGPGWEPVARMLERWT